MANTLTNGSATITLPDDLMWTDEFTWQPVEQSERYTIAGALIVQAASKLAGRTITLEGGRNFGWMQRGDVLTLQSWRAQPGLQMTLAFRGEAPRTVVFDHKRTSLEAPLVPANEYSDPINTDWCIPTIRLLEV